MFVNPKLKRIQAFRFNHQTGEFTPEKDWDQYEGCQTCRGRAEIAETPEGELVCNTCRAKFPKPVT